MLTGCLLVRNEADRWLETVLKQMSICDRIVILDDHSTDNTPEICAKYGEVFYSDKPLWEKDEVRQRKLLWELVNPKVGDWILCLDADETIPDIELLPEKIELADALGCDGLSFKLYDMWNETHYRDDDLWCAHYGSWIMCVKFTDRDYKWCEKPLHCGRFPENAVTLLGETNLKLQHWGWSKPEDRKIKFDRYIKSDPNGEYGNLKQYLSIMDEKPNLRRFE